MKSVTQSPREGRKVKDQSTKPSAKGTSEGERHDEVARKAYELFERRGGAHGHDVADWMEAEQLVARR